MEVSFLCATELSLAVCVRDSIKTAFFSLCWWMNVWRCGGGSARLACKCGVLEMWECTFLHRHHTHSFCLIFLCLLCVSVCLFALYVCWWWTLRRYIVVILSFIVDEGGGFLSRKNLLFHSGWLRLSEKKKNKKTRKGNTRTIVVVVKRRVPPRTCQIRRPQGQQQKYSISSRNSQLEGKEIPR